MINPSNLPSAIPRIYAFRDHNLDLVFSFPTGYNLDNISSKLFYKEKFHAGLVSISINGQIVTATLTKEDFLSIGLPVFQIFIYKGDKSILSANIELKASGGTPVLQNFNVSLGDESVISVEVVDAQLNEALVLQAQTAATDAIEAKTEAIQANQEIQTVLPALQTDINAKVNKTTTINSKPLTSNIVINKTDIGLPLVDNTADSVKPVSAPQQTALDLRIPLTQKGIANGVGTLGSDLLQPLSQVKPSFAPLSNTTSIVSDFLKTGNTYYGFKDFYTGEDFTVAKASNLPDGTLITDTDIDNIIYFKFSNGDYGKRVIKDNINIKVFGAKGDGSTNDSANILSAINKTKKQNTTFLFPAGTYKVPTLATVLVDRPIKLLGQDAVLDFGGDRVNKITKIFDVKSDINITGITFKNGGWILDPSNNPSNSSINIKIKDCVFDNVHAPVQFTNIYLGTVNLGTINISCKDNIVKDCYYSFAFNGITGSNSVIITGNDINGVSKLGGIRIGEDDPTDRVNIKNIVVSNNTFSNIYGLGGAQYDGNGNIIGGDANRGTANAISVFGRNVIVQNNVIDNNTTDSGFDGEAIYGKVDYGNISNNVINNSPAIEGAINFKTGKKLIINENIISNCFRGIQAAASDDMSISGNVMELVTDAGIHIQQRGNRTNSETRFYNLNNNIINNSPLAQCGIRVRGWGGNINIIGNIISDIGRNFNVSGGGAGSGIVVDAGDNTAFNPDGSALVATMENITILGNNIQNIYGADGVINSSFKGSGINIRVRTGDITLKNVVINSNSIGNTLNGINLSCGGTKLKDVNIVANMIFGEVSNKIIVNSADLAAGRIENVNILNYGANGSFDRNLNLSYAFVSTPLTAGTSGFTIKTPGILNALSFKSPSGFGQPVRISVMDGTGAEESVMGIATETNGSVTRGNFGLGTLVPIQKLEIAGNGLMNKLMMRVPNTVPVTRQEVAPAGELRITNQGIYIATANNVWERVEARKPIVTKTASYTIGLFDETALFDCTSGNLIANLPTAASTFAGGSGQNVTIKKIDNTINVVTVDANGTEKIDGQLTYVLSAQYQFVTLQSDGTQWFIISKG